MYRLWIRGDSVVCGVYRDLGPNYMKNHNIPQSMLGLRPWRRYKRNPVLNFVIFSFFHIIFNVLSSMYAFSKCSGPELFMGVLRGSKI